LAKVDARLKARKAAYRKAKSSASLLPHVISPTYEALILLLLQTAIRGGDVVQLRWTDLDEQAMTVMLDGLNIARGVFCPLTPALLALLQRLPRTSSRVFDFGAPCGFRAVWQRFCKRSGLTTLTLHRLRNEAVFRAQERFGNEVELRAFLGYSLLTGV
jgi:integrase